MPATVLEITQRAWLIELRPDTFLIRNYPGMPRDTLVPFLHEASNWILAVRTIHRFQAG